MRTATTEPAGAPSRALGFAFQVIPAAVLEDHRAGKLTARDLIVISEMIRLGRLRGRSDSCWTTKDVLAQRLGVTPRTIGHAWRRLKARGWIVEQVVGPVDPEDHRNRTGRRYRFGWVVQGKPSTAGGATGISPPIATSVSPNSNRRKLSLKETTDVVVLDSGQDPEGTGHAETSKGPTIGGPSTNTSGSSHAGDHPHAAPLPAPLAEALASPAIGEPLRRQIGRMIPRWLASHPAERVAAALRAMIEAARHRRVRSPVAYLIGTLRNLEAEGDRASELAPPPPPTRTPDADSTADRLAQIRREEATMAERERRWTSLPEADRRRIEAQVEAGHPRPAGIPERLWRLTRHAACLERMEEDGRPPAQPAPRTRRMTRAGDTPSLTG